MSRRGRHGRHPHPYPSARPARPATATPEAPATQPAGDARDAKDARPAGPSPAAEQVAVSHAVEEARPGHVPEIVQTGPTAPAIAPGGTDSPASAVADSAQTAARAPNEAAGHPAALATPPAADGPGAQANASNAPGETPRTNCTTAQLRRFIKSRPWVPMHELRRRFGIWGVDDDVSPMHVGDHTLFIGLPPSESRMIAELLNGGDVGYELSLDPEAPIVVGVYPMRPVPRS